MFKLLVFKETCTSIGIVCDFRAAVKTNFWGDFFFIFVFLDQNLMIKLGSSSEISSETFCDLWKESKI